MQVVTDEELYRLYIDGSEEALRELLERFDESLLGFVYSIVGNIHDAEEIEIDTFASLKEAGRHFRGDASFKTWLFSIARRQALKSLRSRPPLVSALEDYITAEALPENPPEEDILRSERQKELKEAMQSLKAEYRDALYLSYFEEMNREEIATIMHKTERQVSDLLYRGKSALKEILEQRGGI